ncbi:MAG: NUDIX domain-containing protein [Chlamydiales bacterium]|nr:NUDIX domain-containing protein [Chlamydiales bacterium]
MDKVYAFGIIPVREGKMLLVLHQKGHWAFPKGHPEKNETPIETAKRELKEETGLEVSGLLGKEFQEHYTFDTTEKYVTYFLAKVRGEVVLQECEIADFRWVTFEEAQKLATFAECKKLVREVHAQIGSKEGKV